MLSTARTRLGAGAVAVAAALTLAACDGVAEVGAPTPTPTPTSTPTPVERTPTASPDEPAHEEVEPLAGEPTTEEREAPAQPGTVAVTDVRVASHDGFDRIVLETEGDGVPGWMIRYTDAAYTAGRGDEIPLEGDAVLQIAVQGVTLPPDLPNDIERWEDERAQGAPGGVIHEVVADTIFEGVQSFFAGVGGELPFLVERLEDPRRIVVDVFDA